MNKADFQAAMQSNNAVQNAKATETLLFGDDTVTPDLASVSLTLAAPNMQQPRVVNLDLRKGAKPYQIVLSDATIKAILADIKASLETIQTDNTAKLKAAGIDLSQ